MNMITTVDRVINRAGVILAAVMMIAVPVRAAETAYWDGTSTTGDADGGTGTWNTSATNWNDAASGGNSIAWDANTSGDDTAVLGGAGGTVTLGETINIGNLDINANTYTIQGNTLNFAPNSSITNLGNKVHIESGISGSPDINVSMPNSWGLGMGTDGLKLLPTSDPMHIGTMYRNTDNYLEIGGTTTATNTLDSIALVPGGSYYANQKLRWTGSTWAVGDVYGGEFYIQGGNLIANGKLTARQNIQLEGGTLSFNNSEAIGSNGKPLYFEGGNLDNTSGTAITSAYDFGMNWSADWTFLGTNDLNLGAGNVSMNASRTVTVDANSLTVGGVISGVNFNLTKAGAGTLVLDGNNTYTGDTIVSAGTLTLNNPYLADISNVNISGGTLNLNYSGTDTIASLTLPGGLQATGKTYGAIGSGADIQTSYITGAGLLYAPTPVAVVGTRWWEGANSGGNGNQQSDGGSGTWNTSTLNWDAGALVPRESWDNAATPADKAVFAGTAGTVTLAEDINLGDMTIEIPGYIFKGGTLNFAPGSTIAVTSTTGSKVTFECGIAGAPTVIPAGSVNNDVTFSPATGQNMVLGTVDRIGADDNYLYFNGAAGTNNSVVEVTRGNTNGKVRFKGQGTWTVGDVYGGEITIYSGNVIANGELTADKWQIELRDGVLHWNNDGAVKGPSDGNSNTLRFKIKGGSIDNTSGSARASTYNPRQEWNGDWTFIGSNGAASDLYMGNGGVSLGTTAETTRTVTVQNADTTLTVGGVISNGTNSTTPTTALTKAGAGTLKLTGQNTYTGPTTITAGTLEIGNDVETGLVGGSINSSSGMEIANGAELKYNSLTPLTANVSFGVNGGTISGTGQINSQVVAGDHTFLAPGNSPGSQTYAGGLTLLGNGDPSIAGTYVWEVADVTGGPGVGWDLVNVTGGVFDISALSPTNPFNIAITGIDNVTAPAGASATFTILDWTGATLNGAFNANDFLLTTTGFGTDWDGTSWVLDQNGSTLELTVSSAAGIPEPATGLLTGLGLAAFCLRRRRAG